MPHKGHAHSIGSIVPSARSRYAGQRSEAQEKLRPSAPSIRMMTSDIDAISFRADEDTGMSTSAAMSENNVTAS